MDPRDLLLFLFGFACGSLPFSVWLARALAGAELSSLGDGNPGAANAWLAGGWRVGFLALAERVLCVARFRLLWVVAAGYPAIVAMGALIALSWLLTRAGQASWKGRLLPAGR